MSNHKYFKVHLLTDEGIEKCQELAKRFEELADFIVNSSLEGREQSLALTKLEEASFFSKKSIAMNYCK